MSSVEKSVWKHWYEVVSGESLRQGDIFGDLIVPVMPHDLPLLTESSLGTLSNLSIQWKKGAWIVFSASCDLELGRSIPFVTLGNIIKIEALYVDSDSSRDKKTKAEILRKGLMPSKFRLADHPNASPPLSDAVVDFKHHLSVPTDYLRRACTGDRLRLRPPFREAFGNWVGSNMSRVGIEVDTQIPKGKGGVSLGRLLDLVGADEPGPIDG